jgi:hypothetical protein
MVAFAMEAPVRSGSGSVNLRQAMSAHSKDKSPDAFFLQHAHSVLSVGTAVQPMHASRVKAQRIC